MASEETVYDQSYQFYLDQIRELDFETMAPVLGATVKANRLVVSFFCKDYTISGEGISGPTGGKPRYDTCVILSKYLLMCPETHLPVKDEINWVSFRNFKDSRPLFGYFSTSVEGALASSFTGNLDNLKKASLALEGGLSALDVSYDHVVQFKALPMVPIVLLFNDADEEFSAQCTILFSDWTESYLDAECIAMVGAQLVSRLKRAVA